jgi:MFS transporter, DHA1 family, multidrug resistance protein
LSAKLPIASRPEISKQQRVVYIFVIGFLLMIQTLVTDMYLPAFPNIAEFFKVPDAFVQYSLSAVTLGSSIGFFIAGPLSDSLGRKRPVLFAIGLFSFASFGMFLAPSIEMFVLLRFLQGLASAAAAVIAQAIIRDLFVGNAMLKMLGRVWLISGIAPIISPLIAGQLLLVGDWRVIALTLGFLTATILLIASRALVETLHVDNRRAKGFEGVNRRFIAVFKDRIILGLMLIGMAQSVALFAYLNNLPFLYQDSFGLTPVQFSYALVVGSIFWFTGIQVGAKLGRIFKAQWVVLGALSLAMLSGVALYFVGVAGLGLWSVIPLVSIFIFSFGTCITPSQTIALQGHGAEAGTAASVLGVMTGLTASLAAPLYPLIGSENTINLGLAIALTHLLAIVAFFTVLRPRSVPDLVKE